VKGKNKEKKKILKFRKKLNFKVKGEFVNIVR